MSDQELNMTSNEMIKKYEDEIMKNQMEIEKIKHQAEVDEHQKQIELQQVEIKKQEEQIKKYQADIQRMKNPEEMKKMLENNMFSKMKYSFLQRLEEQRFVNPSELHIGQYYKINNFGSVDDGLVLIEVDYGGYDGYGGYKVCMPHILSKQIEVTLGNELLAKGVDLRLVYRGKKYVRHLIDGEVIMKMIDYFEILDNTRN